MTAVDIIKANPGLAWEPHEIAGRPALKGFDETGAERWVIWNGDRHVAAAAPWPDSAIRHAFRSLGISFPTKTETT